MKLRFGGTFADPDLEAAIQGSWIGKGYTPAAPQPDRTSELDLADIYRERARRQDEEDYYRARDEVQMQREKARQNEAADKEQLRKEEQFSKDETQRVLDRAREERVKDAQWAKDQKAREKQGLDLEGNVIEGSLPDLVAKDAERKRRRGEAAAQQADRQKREARAVSAYERETKISATEARAKAKEAAAIAAQQRGLDEDAEATLVPFYEAKLRRGEVVSFGDQKVSAGKSDKDVREAALRAYSGEEDPEATAARQALGFEPRKTTSKRQLKQIPRPDLKIPGRGTEVSPEDARRAREFEANMQGSAAAVAREQPSRLREVRQTLQDVSSGRGLRVTVPEGERVEDRGGIGGNILDASHTVMSLLGSPKAGLDAIVSELTGRQQTVGQATLRAYTGPDEMIADLARKWGPQAVSQAIDRTRARAQEGMQRSMDASPLAAAVGGFARGVREEAVGGAPALVADIVADPTNFVPFLNAGVRGAAVTAALLPALAETGWGGAADWYDKVKATGLTADRIRELPGTALQALLPILAPAGMLHDLKGPRRSAPAGGPAAPPRDFSPEPRPAVAPAAMQTSPEGIAGLDELGTSIEQALQQPPAAPRISEWATPEQLGMEPFDAAVDAKARERLARGERPGQALEGRFGVMRDAVKRSGGTLMPDELADLARIESEVQGRPLDPDLEAAIRSARRDADPAAAVAEHQAAIQAATTIDRRGRERTNWRDVPEPPRDEAGNPILPGQEGWTPEQRAAVQGGARAVVDDLVAQTRREPPGRRPMLDEFGRVDFDRAEKGGSGAEWYGVKSHKAGTGLEGIPASPTEMQAALKRDKGNPLELDIYRAIDEHARVEKERFDESRPSPATDPDLAAAIEQARRLQRDAGESPLSAEKAAAADASFDPEQLEPRRRPIYEKTALGDQALIPGTLDAAASLPARKPTETFGDSPLFRQDEEARARQEEAAFRSAQRELPGTEQRAAERRQQEQPVAADRRLTQRRVNIAAEVGLPESHPAVERAARAELAARTDKLTGLGNRAYWDELVEPLGPAGAPTGKGRAVVLDARGLKEANDLYGHGGGDALLKGFAEVMEQHFGADSARWGGDEFGGVLWGADEAKTLATIDALRSSLAAKIVTGVDAGGKPFELRGIEAHIGAGDTAHAADAAERAAHEEFYRQHPEKYRNAERGQADVRSGEAATPAGTGADSPGGRQGDRDQRQPQLEAARSRLDEALKASGKAFDIGGAAAHGARVVSALAEYAIAKGLHLGMRFREWSASILSELGAGIRPYLRRAWEDARGQVAREQRAGRAGGAPPAGTGSAVAPSVPAPRPGASTADALYGALRPVLRALTPYLEAVKDFKGVRGDVPVGAQLADRLTAYVDKWEHRSSRQFAGFWKATRDLSKPEQAQVVRILDEGPASVPDASKAALRSAAVVRELLDEVADRARSADIFAGRLENYFPHKFENRWAFDLEAENAARKAFEADGGTVSGDAGGPQTWLDENGRVLEPMDIAQKVNEAASGLAKVHYDVRSYNRRQKNLEFQRNLEEPREDYRRDLGVVGEYLLEANRRIAEAEELGPKLERAREALYQISPERGERDYAMTGLLRMTGREPRNWMHQGSDVARKFSAITKLGFGAFNQLGSIANTVGAAGVRASIKAVSEVGIPGTKSFREARYNALKSGALFGNISNEIMTTWGTGPSKRATWNVPGKAYDTAAKHLWGVPYVDAYMRIVASAAAKHAIPDMVAKGDWKGLRKMSLEPDVARKVSAALKSGEQLSPVMKRVVERAEKRLSDKTQYRTGIAEMPLWSTSPAGRLLTQFMPFMYQHGRAVTELVRTKDYRALGRYVAAAVVVGEGAASLKSIAQGYGMAGEPPNDDEGKLQWALEIMGNRRVQADFDKPGTIAERALQDFVYAGGVGLYQTALERAARMRSLEDVGGPALGDIGKVARAANAAAGGRLRPAAKAASEMLIPGFGSQVGTEFFRDPTTEAKSPAYWPGWVGRGKDLLAGDTDLQAALEGGTGLRANKDSLSPVRRQQRDYVMERREGARLQREAEGRGLTRSGGKPKAPKEPEETWREKTVRRRRANERLRRRLEARP